MADRDFNPKEGRWFYVMFELADALMKADLTSVEYRLILCIMRYAYPHGRPWADLRWSFILEKTGLSPGGVSKAKSRLIKRNILKCSRMETKSTVRYRINSKPSKWKTVHGWKPVHVREQNCSRMETTSIKEKIKNKDIYSAVAWKIIDRINELSGKHFRYSNTSLVPIIEILNKGFSLEDCLKVVENKWTDPEFKEKYYRPTTLFQSSLFEGHLNESGSKPKPKTDKAQNIVGVFARRFDERHNNQD